MNELFRNTDPDNRTDMEILDPGQATPAEAQAAFQTEQRIVHNIRQMRTLWITIAEDLYRFHELDMWRDLGNNTFEEWLAGPDVDLGRRTVFGLIEVWRELVIHRGVKPKQISDVPISKLRDVLAAVRRGYVDPEDAIADCRTLGRVDLRDRYSNLSTPGGARRDPAGALPPGPPPASGSSNIRSENGAGGASFDATDEPRWAICPSCGSRYEVKR